MRPSTLVAGTPFLGQMLYPPLLTRLDVFVAEGAAVGHGWSFGSQTFLHFCMSSILSGWNCFFAFGAAFVVLVLLALSQKVVVEGADFDCLAASRTECDHGATRVEMFVSIVVVFQAFIEQFAIVTVVLWILRLL